MDKTMFASGDYIKNENGEKQYYLLEAAKYNDKYYVVHAIEISTNRDCLLKFIECEDDSYKLNNLTREGGFCFYYPYIEQVYGNFSGFAPNGDKIYGVALEFIHGKNLKEFRRDLEKRISFGDIEESEAEWLIFRQMLQFLYGMKYYTEYSKQIYLHRDIKPENVMITDFQDEVVIVDFDFAHIAGSTRTTNLVGWDVAFSRGYTSPEVFVKQKDIGWDISTDVYSAGRLFFFWLNGQQYFTDEQLEIEQKGQPSSTVYCANRRIGYGIDTNKSRFKKKYLGDKYAMLRKILARMCCNPEEQQPYARVSEIISDMEIFLLDLCGDSWKELEEKLKKQQWRLLQEQKSSANRDFSMVAYSVPSGGKVGQPLYENTIRDVIWDEKFMFSVCNFGNQITLIPPIGRDIEICRKSDKHQETEIMENDRIFDDYIIKNGDIIICDGISFAFTIV